MMYCYFRTANFVSSSCVSNAWDFIYFFTRKLLFRSALFLPIIMMLTREILRDVRTGYFIFITVHVYRWYLYYIYKNRISTRFSGLQVFCTTKSCVFVKYVFLSCFAEIILPTTKRDIFVFHSTCRIRHHFPATVMTLYILPRIQSAINFVEIAV